MTVMERDSMRQHDAVRYRPLWSICLRRGLRLRVQHPSKERPYGMYTGSADVRTRLVPIEPRNRLYTANCQHPCQMDYRGLSASGA